MLSVVFIERSKDEEASLVKVFLLPQKERINIIVNGHKAFLSLSCTLFPTMLFNLDKVYDHA